MMTLTDNKRSAEEGGPNKNNEILKKVLESGVAMNKGIKGNPIALAIYLFGGLAIGVLKYLLALQEANLKS